MLYILQINCFILRWTLQSFTLLPVHRGDRVLVIGSAINCNLRSNIENSLITLEAINPILSLVTASLVNDVLTNYTRLFIHSIDLIQ